MGIEKDDVGPESSENEDGIADTGNGRIPNALFVRYKYNYGTWTLMTISAPFFNNIVTSDRLIYNLR